MNQGHGFAVDVWACGILLYELLAGQPPFWHENPMDTYNAIMHGVRPASRGQYSPPSRHSSCRRTVAAQGV